MSSVLAFDPVLVTGAAGFVGACLTRRLLELGHKVHVLLRPGSRAWRLDGVWNCLHVHRADLTDPKAVGEVVARTRPAVVAHLATHGAYESQASARPILETNIIGTQNLLEACATTEVRLLINVGSSSEYGFKNEPMRETDRLEPNSFYSVAKSAQTYLCTYWAQRCGLPAVTLRLFSVYGPWEEPSRLVPTILRRAKANLPLEMTTPETARDFVYVDDVLAALLDFVRLVRLTGEVINLGTGRESTLRQLVSTALTLLGSHSDVRWGAMRSRHWDTSCWVADATKAKRLLGWTPRYSLRTGLTETWRWMESTEVNHEFDNLHAAVHAA